MQFIHSFVVFSKNVDYHDPPTVSLSNDDAGAPALSRSPHRVRSRVVFRKKVDYHDSLTVSLFNDEAGAPVLSLTLPCQTRRRSLQALTAIFSAPLLYHGNTRGLNLKN